MTGRGHAPAGFVDFVMGVVVVESAAIGMASDVAGPPQPEALTPRGAYERLQADEPPVLLDVRTREEWLYDGRIPGATWIPMGELPLRADRELSPDRPVIVVCAHGVRSGAIARFLVRKGFTTVADLSGGIQAWEEAGLPVERG